MDEGLRGVAESSGALKKAVYESRLEFDVVGGGEAVRCPANSHLTVICHTTQGVEKQGYWLL